MFWGLRIFATLPRFALVLALSLLVGCALPGGLRRVGGQSVSGVLKDFNGVGISNQPIVLVQGHFDRLDKNTLQYVTDELDEYKLERVVIVTDKYGKFHHDLRGFTHCSPFWLLPPLGSLPSKFTGEARHGRFFIVQTTGVNGEIYEIDLGSEQPDVKIYDPKKRKTINQKRNPDKESVVANARIISEPETNSIYKEEVTIEIRRYR